MKVGVVTREFPPEVYGGAGVHVDELTRALRDHVDVGVYCFGAERDDPRVAGAFQPWSALDGRAAHVAALRTMSVDLAIAEKLGGVDVVHTHTWYANFAGHIAKLVHGTPHVMTTHSLEPLRPWKAEQLGGGYALSSFCERVAIESADRVIAVSNGMRDDILRVYPSVGPERVVVVHNGVDPERVRRTEDPGALAGFGIDLARPYVAFVGRITRQKGVTHLLDAMRYVDPRAGLVLCAGDADTPELAAEVRAKVSELAREREGVVWIERMVSRDELLRLLSHARVFCCPSIYEPFGIVNLEAMACEVPVVASHVGGIPEIVVDGITGALVRFDSIGDATGAPRDPEAFARALARALDPLIADDALARRWGLAGRRRVEQAFSWRAIAKQTAAIYAESCSGA